MSTSTGSTLNDIPISVVVQPPPQILVGNNVRLPVVVKYGPMPLEQAPSEVHGILHLVDATTNQPIRDRRALVSNHGYVQTAVSEQEGNSISFYILFHNVTLPKPGSYQFAVSVFEPSQEIVNNEVELATRKLGDVKTDAVNVGEVGGPETYSKLNYLEESKTERIVEGRC